MTGPPVPFDSLFAPSSSTPKDEETPPVPFDQLFGGAPSPAVTADQLVQSVKDKASITLPGPLPNAWGGIRTQGMTEDLPPGARVGEGRADRLMRQSQEYLHSPQKVLDDMKNDASITAAPGFFGRFRQNVGSMRLFTDDNLVEFNMRNNSGFHVGTPIAHPLETAKNLVIGIPKFFHDLIDQPATLVMDAFEPGTGYLLPEERDQYIRETIANYAGLAVGGSLGTVSKELRIGRDILRSQVGKGAAFSLEESAALARTLPKALQVEKSIPGRIITGIHEGASAGATTGFALGTTPEERRNLAATYALMAIPAGIGFEAGKHVISRFRDDGGFELGPATAAAVQAQDFAVLRQMQASESRTLHQNTESFYQMATHQDLASAAIRASAELGGIVIPAVENPNHLVHGNIIPIRHLRPDGLYDLAFGVPEIERPKIEPRPWRPTLKDPGVVSATLTLDDGRVFESGGGGHEGAWEKAQKAGVPDDHPGDMKAGFRLRDGRIVSQRELARLLDVDTVDSGEVLDAQGNGTEYTPFNPGPGVQPKTGEWFRAVRAKDGTVIRGTEYPNATSHTALARAWMKDKFSEGPSQLRKYFDESGLREFIHPKTGKIIDVMDANAGPISSRATTEVMKRIGELGFTDILKTETDARGERTAINIEHAARTILHDYETLLDEGVDFEAARRTMILQHEIQTRKPTKAEATAMFEVSGHFPNEHVSYLGKDYYYDRPVISSKGELQGHILKLLDGTEISVPWDQIRRGPDLLLNSYEVTPPKVKRALFTDFMKAMKRLAPAGELTPLAPFGELVQKYAAERHIPQGEVAPLTAFLGEQFAEQLRNESLSPDENAAFRRMQHESKRYPVDIAGDLVNTATSNGMFVDHTQGGVVVRESETGAKLGAFNSAEEAKQFINTSGQADGANLTPGGPVPPDAINRGLMPVPPPPNGPHTTAFMPHKDGIFSQLNHLVNTSWVGTHFLTGMQQIMKSLDAQLGTEFYARVGDPLQVAFKKRFAASNADMKRAGETSKMAKGLTADQMQDIMTSLTTMHPDDLVKAGGMFGRAFTDRELTTAEWFVRHQIDTKKVFDYNRAEARLRKKFADEPKKLGEAIKALQIRTNVDEAHVQAAKIFQEFQALNRPDLVSVEGIARLTDAIMDGHKSPEEFMTRTNFTPQMRVVRTAIAEHLKDLGIAFPSLDAQKLGGHLVDLRNKKQDAVFIGPEGVPVLTSELLKSGELSEYDRDPINFLVRTINHNYDNRFTKVPVQEALRYIEQATDAMPEGKKYVRELLTTHYVNQLRGIPNESSSFTQKMFDGILDRLGLKTSLDLRRDLVNTMLSLSSSAAIGFRPMQGIRDFHNFTSIYYTRFGAARTAQMLTMMHRVTPQELVAAGILKEAKTGESVPEAFTREGLSSTYGAISVLTPQERLANTLSARSQPLRTAIQDAADLGIKWGLQHNVYQWAHAASFLETSTHALKELNALAEGRYGQGDAAKAKAYDNMFINSYDLPVIKEFDRLVIDGNFRSAADFLARASAFETVSTFGLANHPAGWGSSTGRLFGQFGSWPVWARSTLARMATRGTLKERAGVAARFGLTQGSLFLASAAFGLNLNSWYLPMAAPLASAAQHIGAATEMYDEDQTRELQRAAATVVLGVPGSLMFRGGPALTAVGAAIAAGSGYQQGEDEAVRAIKSLPLLAVPGSFLLKDIAEGVAMAQQGDNPISVWLRAFGVRSNENPSLLNPAGTERPHVSDLEF